MMILSERGFSRYFNLFFNWTWITV